MKNLIVVLGPTGVGKPELCISLAEHLAIPIINADSRQIFAELPIGTAARLAYQAERFALVNIDAYVLVSLNVKFFLLKDGGLCNRKVFFKISYG